VTPLKNNFSYSPQYVSFLAQVHAHILMVVSQIELPAGAQIGKNGPSKKGEADNECSRLGLMKAFGGTTSASGGRAGNKTHPELLFNNLFHYPRVHQNHPSGASPLWHSIVHLKAFSHLEKCTIIVLYCVFPYLRSVSWKWGNCWNERLIFRMFNSCYFPTFSTTQIYKNVNV
jgi:hypothetical protein